ncbi:MAG: MBL fold metallo-hydrolase [Erysipelotrichaceae bacterium]|nr:MBL fold metallo-hydrolase [Erysipelotrichaceae bacterium]
MKTIRENPALFCLLVFLYVCCYEKYRYTALVCCLALWLLRTKDKSVIVVGLLLITLWIPRYDASEIHMHTGKAEIVNGSYAILSDRKQKVLVYTDKPLYIDAEYKVEGPYQKITKENGFYRFDYERWASSYGVSYCADEGQISFVKKHHSFRSFLQNQIQKADEKDQPLLYRSLLNIRMKDYEEEWFYANGFSYVGILSILNVILARFIDWKKRNKILIAVSLFLIVVYRFPLLVVQSLLFRLLSYTDLDPKEKTGICLGIIMLVYPSQIYSLSFLIPALYRISVFFTEHRKLICFNGILMLQSVLLHAMNPVMNLCYRFLQKLYGLLWFLSLLSLFLPFVPIRLLDPFLSYILQVLSLFEIPGSMFGEGLLFFILLVIVSLKKKYFHQFVCILLLVFQITGLFHPFMELAFINIGQGDSILLRAPLNSQNILIDTGKPSAWNALDDYLKSEGIHHLDTLIITHSDNDHSGNKENIEKKYKPEHVITTHKDKTISGIFTLYDLNNTDSDNENASSIVNYVKAGNQNVCLMADVEQDQENEIAEKYNHLHCNILKLSHHGSKTGSSDEFLDTVRPDLAVISAGAYRIYHHPSEETMQKLLKRHIPYCLTRDAGDIRIVFLPFGTFLITSEGNTAFLRGQISDRGIK